MKPDETKRRKMRFQDVIAPITPDKFIHRYLGEEMLLVCGSKGRFTHLLSWDDLNGALNRIRVSDRRIRLHQDGKELDPDRYLAELDHPYGSPIKGAELERLLAAGATLLFGRVDELFPPIRELCVAFEETFRVPTWVNLYAGWRRDNGFSLHFDGHDTMILQVHGRKHWKVYGPTRVHPFKNDIHSVETPKEPPVWEGVLEEGGVLYMPRGWWHVACPLDEPSLHLTVGLAHPTGVEMLEWLRTELEAEVGVRMDVPHLKTAEEQSAWLRSMRERIMNIWTDDAIGRFMAVHDASAVARPDVHLPESAARHLALTPESRLRLASGRRLSLAGDSDHDLVPALSRLNHLRSESIADLSAAVPPAAVPRLRLFLEALAMSGVVSVEPPLTVDLP
jgi:ribosomal protein L16 Arg81 hydroxylase